MLIANFIHKKEWNFSLRNPGTSTFPIQGNFKTLKKILNPYKNLKSILRENSGIMKLR